MRGPDTKEVAYVCRLRCEVERYTPNPAVNSDSLPKDAIDSDAEDVLRVFRQTLRETRIPYSLKEDEREKKKHADAFLILKF